MIQIFALTELGCVLAKKLQTLLPEDDIQIHFKPKPFAQTVQQAFEKGDKLIFICATGIVMRTLAPVLKDKHQDPPVLVLDEMGEFVIPLLSGHEGGANDWAYQVSSILNSQLVITTAAPYLKPVYSIGMGCERDCPLVFLEELMLKSLTKAGLTIEQIESFNSIDIKSDEVNLIALAKKYNKPYRTWSIAELSPMKRLLSTHSDYVFNTVGVYGVAESACLVSCQKLTQTEPELILSKQKNTKATCAIARSFPAKDV